ncbi:amidase activator ActS [Kluyvera georgiana]|uniref:amidase activator ActS n=1 Tax=Kluyvera georgiana TaxID=73098 RepID=UPI003D95BE65
MTRGYVLRAGSQLTSPLRLLMCLIIGLALSGCAGNSSEGSYSGSVYTVKRGDTLSRISRMTGTSVRDLARMNGISPPYTIEVGQKLKVSGASSSSTKKSTASKTAKVVPSSAVPQSSWPPVGQRCWRWPASGKVVMTYSTSEGGNKGIDIAGSRGQPVYAAGAGKVVYVGNQLRGYGNLVMIKHNEDYITAYAHNDKLMVNNGQSVKIGQQIATMGSSDADSVRLHFQIRYRATAIDPLRYLPPQGSKPKC